MEEDSLCSGLEVSMHERSELGGFQHSWRVCGGGKRDSRNVGSEGAVGQVISTRSIQPVSHTRESGFGPWGATADKSRKVTYPGWRLWKISVVAVTETNSHLTARLGAVINTVKQKLEGRERKEEKKSSRVVHR